MSIHYTRNLLGSQWYLCSSVTKTFIFCQGGDGRISSSMTYFDPWKAAKLQDAQRRIAGTTVNADIDDLDDLQKLAGIGEEVAAANPWGGGMKPRVPEASLTPQQKHERMRAENIKPGTDAWFRLWFGNQR